MSDTTHTAAPLHPSGPPGGPAGPAAPSQTRSNSLLTLLRKVFDYGKAVLEVLKQPPSAARDDVARIANRFRTPNIQLIAARIMRGLHLALALKQKLQTNAARLDAAPALRPVPLPLAPLPPLPRLGPPPVPPARVQSPVRHGTPADDARLLYRMPTPEEIAARVLHRPIGEVFADICIDLGINQQHPLWEELREAIERNGGRIRRVLLSVVRRMRKANREFARAAKQQAADGVRPDAAPAAAPAAAAATGPP